MPNLTRSTGNTGGLIKDVAALALIESKNDRELRLYDGRRYLTGAVLIGAGVQLASLNYANPIADPQTATNTGNISTNTSEIAIAKLNDDIKNNQVGTAYTLQSSDRGKSVYMDNAAANVITIDSNANEACVVNMVAMLRQKGAGLTTVTAINGVSLNGIINGSVDLDGQRRSASINQEDLNDWWIEGMTGTVI